MTVIQTWTQEQVTIDFHQEIYEKVQSHYKDFSYFLDFLQYFITDLEKNINLCNINPYQERINKGVYILGKNGSEFGIFSKPNLALKCSQGQLWAENLRKQFHQTIKLANEFDIKLDREEKNFFKSVQFISIFKPRTLIRFLNRFSL